MTARIGLLALLVVTVLDCWAITPAPAGSQGVAGTAAQTFKGSGALLGATSAIRKDSYVTRRRSVTDLPGWGTVVTQAERERLHAATLKIGVRETRGGSISIQASCSAVKVRLIDGSSAALTAAHCFPGLTGHTYGLLTAGRNGYPRTQEARDLLAPDLAGEYLLFDPHGPGANLWDREIGRIAGIAVMPGVDVALLNVETKRSGNPVGFDRLPALSPNAVSHAPLAGQSVALSAVPSSSNDELIGGTGVYIGRITQLNVVENARQTLDVVAQSPKRAAEDPGYFGASGSAAMLVDGSILPSLSWRITVGYGSSSPSPPDSKFGLVHWKEVESQLNVRLPRNKFNVLSYYSVATPQTLATLEAGFGNYVVMRRDAMTGAGVGIEHVDVNGSTPTPACNGAHDRAGCFLSGCGPSNGREACS